MNPFARIVSSFRPPAEPGEARAEPDFDRIGRYFYNSAREEPSFQTIDADTAVDLDLNAVFERIDRTASKVGQQVLYARLRTLRGADDAEDFIRRTDWFAADEACAERCRKALRRLSDDAACDLQNLVFDTPHRVRHIRVIAALSAAAVALLAAGIFLHPLFLLAFAAVFTGNLWFHYGNKLDMSLYTFPAQQLSKAVRTGRDLAGEGVPGADRVSDALRRVGEVERRSRIVSQADGGNELTAILYLLLEIVKIAFNLEVLLFHRFVGSIAARRDAIRDLLRFVGETDAALSVVRLRGEVATCRPRFVDGKYLSVRDAVHPLVDDCVPNTLCLDGTGLLLTGSNMSGKTTFIRTLTLNALLGQTLGICFAAAFEAPYMRLFSILRIADDVQEGASYYLQEVLSVKRLLDAAAEGTPSLFALDELFKGTNTTERIAAGKAVLARLNRGGHLVLCATHDLELAGLLRDDGFELHHFRELVADGRLVFDYRLHAGPLTTRNAIRILELFDYPPELVAEALEVQERLLARAE